MEIPKDRSARFLSGEGSAALVSHTIRFRRPETPYSLSRMTASNRGETITQVQRLKSLGYTIVEIVPPLVEEQVEAPPA